MSAVIAAAGIGAVASIGGSLMAAQASKKAGNQQAAAADRGTQAQMSMYNQTRSDLAPYMMGGSNAFSQLANIFGFGGGNTSPYSQAAYAQGGGGGSGGNWSQYLQDNPDVMAIAQKQVDKGKFGSLEDYAQYHYNTYGKGEGRELAMNPQAIDQWGQATGGGNGQPNPQLATELLTKFPGYQFGLDQGVQALDRSAASQGRILSGAQLQDAQKFGQGYAMQNAWQPYVSQLQWATGVGQNAAAGVGTAGIQTGQGVAGSELGVGQAQAAGTIGSSNAWGNSLAKISDLAQGAASSYAKKKNNNNSGGDDLSQGEWT